MCAHTPTDMHITCTCKKVLISSLQTSQIGPWWVLVQPQLLCPLCPLCLVTVIALFSSLFLCSSDRRNFLSEKVTGAKGRDSAVSESLLFCLSTQKGKNLHAPPSGNFAGAYSQCGWTSSRDLQSLVTRVIDLRELLFCTQLSSAFLLRFKFAGLGMELSLA